MKKRTEVLLIALVLTGSAAAAAMTSDYGIGDTEAPVVSETTATNEAPADATEASATEPASESSGAPVVYEMDIPPEVMSDY